MEAGKGDGFGHLDLHPARARGGCFNESGAGAVSDGEELGLGRARRLRTSRQWPTRARRVVGFVDHGMPRCRTLVAGDLDLVWEPNKTWSSDVTHFTRARRATFAIVDVVGRRWIDTLVSIEETSPPRRTDPPSAHRGPTASPGTAPRLPSPKSPRQQPPGTGMSWFISQPTSAVFSDTGQSRGCPSPGSCPGPPRSRRCFTPRAWTPSPHNRWTPPLGTNHLGENHAAILDASVGRSHVVTPVYMVVHLQPSAEHAVLSRGAS